MFIDEFSFKRLEFFFSLLLEEGKKDKIGNVEEGSVDKECY